MKIKEVLGALEKFAPLPLQDGFDNAGLQIGLTEVEATGALLCLDVTEAVLDEAIALGANLVVSHHPLLFRGFKSITGRDYTERCIIKAIKNDLVIYAAHTNLDNAWNGVNFKMAGKLGLKNVRILQPKEEMLLKLVTFVPLEEAKKVRQALFKAGCGEIGTYDSCSFNTEGIGTFRAQEGAKPYVGKVGENHAEREERIETVLPVHMKGKVLKALLETHPYEEPAFDFYPLSQPWSRAGSGVIGELEEAVAETEFLRHVKKTFEVACLRHNKLTGRVIERVALCGGSGSFLIPDAIAAGADVFLTGEIGYHKFFGHDHSILLAETGHYESEQYTKELLKSILTDACSLLDVYVSEVNTNPIKYL